MGLIVFVILGLLAEAFFLYVLVHWVRDAKPRKAEAALHEKRPRPASPKQTMNVMHFRELEESIHRKIVSIHGFRKTASGKK
jgi:hypothetical protein